MKPRVSIIVPIYNVEKYIERCMESLLKQTIKDIEIILVDDGSPDRCPQICEQKAILDRRIKVIHKVNEGLGYARNSGLEVAEGEYIAFVDSDDYIEHDMFENLYNEAKSKNADIVYGGIFYDFENGQYKKSPTVREKEIFETPENIRELLLGFVGNLPKEKKDTFMEVSVWKGIFRKQIFDDNNVRFVSEREFISEDLIFDIDFLMKTNRVVVVPECYYHYCINQDSLSKVYRSDRFEKVKQLYTHVRIKLKNYNFTDEDIDLRTGRMLIAKSRLICRSIANNRKSIGSSKAKIEIKKICNDEDLEIILNNYPIRSLPIKFKIVATLMKYKQVNTLLYILSR